MSADSTQKTLLHLHTAAQTVLPQSRALASHLASRLLSCADDSEINLPQTYIETRFCQKCGSAFLPGITCVVRNIQSRRQRHKARNLTWLVYECNVCGGKFRTEIETGQTSRSKESVTPAQPVAAKSISTANRRKRERMQGLKKAIDKSREEKTDQRLGLLDLMKLD
jgi:RNase P subunit RPR2